MRGRSAASVRDDATDMRLKAHFVCVFMVVPCLVALHLVVCVCVRACVRVQTLQGIGMVDGPASTSRSGSGATPSKAVGVCVCVARVPLPLVSSYKN